jgi:hypothetical protein
MWVGNRFMAASKVLGEETIAGQASQAQVGSQQQGQSQSQRGGSDT